MSEIYKCDDYGSEHENIVCKFVSFCFCLLVKLEKIVTLFPSSRGVIVHFWWTLVIWSPSCCSTSCSIKCCKDETTHMDDLLRPAPTQQGSHIDHSFLFSESLNEDEDNLAMTELQLTSLRS